MYAIDLKETPTRVLLRWLACSRVGGVYYPNPPYYANNEDRQFTFDELKAELATREHVPNKKEAKAIRQEKAKERRHR